jgi:hypothetical protein
VVLDFVTDESPDDENEEKRDEKKQDKQHTFNNHFNILFCGQEILLLFDSDVKSDKMAQPAAHSGVEYRIAQTLNRTRPASDHHFERWKT